MINLQNHWQETSSKTITSYSAIDRISSHLCDEISMYCSSHRMGWQSFDITILLRTSRNYQEWNSTKRLIWKASENDQHFNQHQQLLMKMTDKTIQTLTETVMNSITNQLILQWLYRFRHDQQIKINSVKIKEWIQDEKIFSEKEKNISIQENTEVLQLWKI